MNLDIAEIERRIADSYELPNNVLEAVPKPVVTVRTSTYQHGDFIADCIEGVLMQETSFPFEYIIGEDFSTDGTRGIVFEYAEQYPDIIRVVTADYNVGSKANGRRCRRRARGKYMALCEGDDYWTDPHKLQKQVDFLEAHPDYSLCFHNVVVRYEEGSPESRLRNPEDQKSTLTLEDILVRNSITTCSVLFKYGLARDLPESYSELQMGDWPKWVLLAQHGKIRYMDEVMATYRVHSGGLWSSSTVLEWLPGRLKACDVVDQELDSAYHRYLEQAKRHWVQWAAHEFMGAATGSLRAADAARKFRAIFAEHTEWDPGLLDRLLGELYATYFFQAAEREDYATVRRSLPGLARYQPSLFRNCGVLSISCEALMGSDVAEGLRQALHWAGV